MFAVPRYPLPNMSAGASEVERICLDETRSANAAERMTGVSFLGKGAQTERDGTVKMLGVKEKS